jgi:hypothetical protein
VSDPDSSRVASDEPEPRKRSWISRLRVSFLSRTLPYYEVRGARKGDSEVIEAAHRRAERRGRLPKDPD